MPLHELRAAVTLKREKVLNMAVAKDVGKTPGCRGIKCIGRHIDFAVVAGIVALALILGVLNNLRVADERKVWWFGAPTDSDDFETTTETIQ